MTRAALGRLYLGTTGPEEDPTKTGSLEKGQSGGSQLLPGESAISPISESGQMVSYRYMGHTNMSAASINLSCDR